VAAPKPIAQILTANRLTNGETVYYTSKGTWSLYVADARIATTQEAADELAKIGAAAYAANQVVDVNVVDVNMNGELKPAHIREIIRATGPTVRRDLNKPLTPAKR
jgi:hypothetical protein